jgi:hypothetical protein
VPLFAPQVAVVCLTMLANKLHAALHAAAVVALASNTVLPLASFTRNESVVLGAVAVLPVVNVAQAVTCTPVQIKGTQFPNGHELQSVVVVFDCQIYGPFPPDTCKEPLVFLHTVNGALHGIVMLTVVLHVPTVTVQVYEPIFKPVATLVVCTGLVFQLYVAPAIAVTVTLPLVEVQVVGCCVNDITGVNEQLLQLGNVLWLYIISSLPCASFTLMVSVAAPGIAVVVLLIFT